VCVCVCVCVGVVLLCVVWIQNVWGNLTQNIWLFRLELAYLLVPDTVRTVSSSNEYESVRLSG
jgi:hypothetical protein